MAFYLNLARIEQDIARAILERNVLNSQRLIAGDFESALADIIQQLERPPLSRGVPLAAVEMTKRIGGALREGLIGLSPNGFEFCTWLWDVAPLHMVNLGTRPISGEMHAAGVLQLRRLAAIIIHQYIGEQPQRLESVIPLLDSSVDWVDARQLIYYGMLDHYLSHFEISYQSLLALAREARTWRALVPLEVGKEMLAEQREYTAMALTFLNAAHQAHDQENLYHAMRLLLRSVLRHGDQAALARYLVSHGASIGLPMLHALCFEIERNAALLQEELRDELRAFLSLRQAAIPPAEAEWMRNVRALLDRNPAG